MSAYWDVGPSAVTAKPVWEAGYVSGAIRGGRTASAFDSSPVRPIRSAGNRNPTRPACATTAVSSR